VPARRRSNLALQPWNAVPGARIMDILEVRLQGLLCDGTLASTDARAGSGVPRAAWRMSL
jgi:hypothetical protein